MAAAETAGRGPLETLGSVLVVGGGITGITAALEAAESGADVYLVEKTPWLGGRVAQLAKYFPKLCPPTCGIEINLRRLRDNPRVRVMTLAEVSEIRGEAGRFSVDVRLAPRFVNDRCTACGLCTEVCPVDRPDAFNYGMSTTRAIYLGHTMAYPVKYAIDPDTCRFEECGACVEVCPYGAIDLAQGEDTVTLDVGAIIMATGWDPYDARAITNLAYGHYPDVITNVMFERMAALNGPTGGVLKRMSDGRDVRRVAFIQCAGSRDRLHLEYCSAVCCLGSLKEATYLLDAVPDAQAYMFYIDLRTPGTYETFAADVLARPGMHAVKGKVADILWDPEAGDLVVVADDMLAGHMTRVPVDLVVLATGMMPSLAHGTPESPIQVDPDAFVQEMPGSGIFAAGCARAPMDVAMAAEDGTAAAMMALRTLAQVVAR